MKKLIFGLALAFAANAAMAAVKIGGLYYNLDHLTMTAEVVAGSSYTTALKGDVEIPASVTGGDNSYAVTSIGHGAFSNCTALESVYAPSVTSIGEAAFSRCTSLTSLTVNSAMEKGWDSKKGIYAIPSQCNVTFYTPPVKVVPNPAANSTAKVYTNGVEVTSNLIVLPFAWVDVVFEAEWGYCFEDYTLVQTNTLEAVNDPTVVDGPVTIKNTVTVEPNPAQHSTAKVYTNGVDVTSNPIVLSNAMVSVVFEVEGGYCFADDHSTTRTNTVEATNDPTEVVGPDVVKIPLMSVEVAQQAEWGISLKSGNQEISPKEYEEACAFYGIAPEPCPQVVKEGEIAVTKESIEAAKAMTVQIVNGQIELGVSVLSNSDITASTAWAPVKFTKDTQIGLSADGTKLVLPIPVAAQQGFMILQSGDAKAVPSDGGTSGFYMIKVVQ